MKWPTVKIVTADGPRDAVAPLILSASRATDIPAFHAEWFAQRLAAGYCKWVNPFNRRPQYVSFQKVRAVVFWTKNAAPIVPLLRRLEASDIIYYFQFTLNDYETEGLEPNLPPLGERVDTFKRLSQLIGRDRVIWRFDPLILTDTISVDTLIQRIAAVGDLIGEHTDKLVISFADIATYVKVRRNLTAHGIHYREFDPAAMREVAHRVSGLAAKWKLTVATCCEDIDLSSCGITHNRCIDDELLLKLSRGNSELLQLFAGDLFTGTSGVSRNPLKDSGQRDVCGCVCSKDIGAYNTCPHLCLYCYANTSRSGVLNCVSRTRVDSDSICPEVGTRDD